MSGTHHGGAQAAATLNLSDRQVRRLADAGHLPRDSHGKYPFPAYVHAYVDYVARGEVAESAADAERELKLEQVRKLRTLNDQAEVYP